ncbi:formimidoylglutamate deiminase [Saccharomonospora cyanea]|uniref:Formiminoglutamate deiminase n=1 Tax=Saccharomonospora cyanea NA-134 TaxID=882082 RepID=H5XHE2_9PSEU|nr:formimidoylglutamate deiminase [Saccharomonospora cyanea]EHR60627.1 formiminoglutamate deiminase [Saccharomonospora cyanea NA-134]
MLSYWCERAWLPDGLTGGVLVTVSADGTITAVERARPRPDSHRLPGVVLPGFANAHSHAFHRALRGRTHGGDASGGTFWTWRETMYRVAERLDPDSYHRLARAVYAEMVLAGVTCVGEFHYVHHAPDGRRYAEPNAMGEALRQAAADAGLRLTLLDTCYLTGGIGEPLRGVQRRFGDGSVAAWRERVEALTAGGTDATTRVGAAVHSVRAVPARELPELAAALPGRPLHVHVSEQPAENAACRAAHGRSPVELLYETGVLSPRTTAVHATHLSPGDVTLLGDSGAAVCCCPSTEADLADGLGPMRELADAGCRLCLGSDQHAVVDPLAESRALEHGERLRSGRRGRFTPGELVNAATVDGHAALGWPEAGRIAPGAPCDLVAVRDDTPRTAGAEPDQVPLVASAADVATVVVGGRIMASEGKHTTLGDVGALLAREVGELWT